MKLKEEFITYKTGESYVAVTANEEGSVLNGMIRGNATAERILRELAEDTTEEQIAAALCEEYEVSPERAAADVHRIVEILREEGLLDE